MRYKLIERVPASIKLFILITVCVFILFADNLFAEDDLELWRTDRVSSESHYTGQVIEANTTTPLEGAIVLITATSVKTGFRHLDIVCENVVLTKSNEYGEFNSTKYGHFITTVDVTTYLPGHEYLKKKQHLGGFPYVLPVTKLRSENIDYDNVTLMMVKSSIDVQDRLLYLYEFIEIINHDDCDNDPNIIAINEQILNEAKPLVRSTYDRFIYHNMELHFFKRIMKKKKLEPLRLDVRREGRRIKYSDHIKLLKSGSENEILNYFKTLSSSISNDDFLLTIDLERDTEHQTPLMIAARRGQEKVVHTLLSFGANPNSINRDTHGSDSEDALLIALYSYQNATRRDDEIALTYRNIVNYILSSKKYLLVPSIAKKLKEMSFDTDKVTLLHAISNRNH